jgi:hypothetical protein
MLCIRLQSKSVLPEPLNHFYKTGSWTFSCSISARQRTGGVGRVNLAFIGLTARVATWKCQVLE